MWTAARYHTFITSALRGGFRRWPPRYTVLKKAQTTKRINPKSGRLAQHYLCAECKVDFPQKDVQVDHTKPVVCPKRGFISWDVFIERLFCEARNLSVLCKPCHLVKTKDERAARIKAKKKEVN